MRLCHQDQIIPNSQEQQIKLLIVFSALQMLLHLGYFIVQRDPRMLITHVVTFLQDLLLLFIIFIIFTLARRLFPALLHSFLKFMTVICLFGLELILASYPHFLREYLAFPIDILAADINSASVFLKEYAGITALWPAVSCLVIGIIALIIPFQIRIPLRKWKIGSIIFLFAILTLPRSSPHPLVYSIQQELISRLGAGRVVPALKKPVNAVAGLTQIKPTINLNKSLQPDHILLIVMEGVTAQDFENEFMTKNDGFYARVKTHAVYFSNYYTTNLDSYTSIIAMLTSVQVPYRAYADVNLYDNVNEGSNLTRTLRSQGYQTLFVSTYANQPFVPTRNDWDSILDRRNLGSLNNWVSLGSSRMEAATEDRAALPEIFKFMANNKQSFVLHELVYGHSPQWQAVTGNSQLNYYDSYLNETLDYLKANGLESRTLMVIVSDHGNRARSSTMENYRIPLLIVGNNVRTLTNIGFRSHLDMQAIIAHYLTEDALPAPHQNLFTVGSTERWIYGEIWSNGEYLFIDDRSGRILSRQGNQDPLQVYKLFQETIDKFGSNHTN